MDSPTCFLKGFPVHGINNPFMFFDVSRGLVDNSLPLTGFFNKEKFPLIFTNNGYGRMWHPYHDLVPVLVRMVSGV